LRHTGYEKMWKISNVTPCWDNSFKEFSYVKQPIKESEIVEWRNQGYYQQSFSGEMYGFPNPMPIWVTTVAEEIGFKDCGYVFYRMRTLDIMPVHVDHFETYIKIFKASRSSVFRAIVFLEDWKPGHYFEIDAVAITDWKMGNYVIWDAETPHAASNIGVDDRYTLQITGKISDI
jgi:hypothetical protein